MRIAVLIIALGLALLVGLQSCAVAVTDTLADDAAGGGAVGILVALCYLLGAAFAIGLPRAAMVVFIIGAALAVLVAATSGFGDMYVWGAVAAALAVMSHFGARELARKRAADLGRGA